MIIRVFGALNWPSSLSGIRIMVQKPRFVQKSKNCRKSMSPTGGLCDRW